MRAVRLNPANDEFIEPDIDSFDAESIWQAMLLRANHHFEQRHYVKAAIIYDEALRFAHSEVNRWRSVRDALAAVVVSALNLAATEVALDNVSSAERQICEVHVWLLAMGKNTELPIVLRIAALQQVSRTYFELKRFQMTHGDLPMLCYWLENSCVCEAWSQCASHGQTVH